MNATAPLLDPSALGPTVGGASQPTESDRKLAFLNGPVDRRVTSADRVQAPATTLLLARKRLVDTKRQFENQVRNVMKTTGAMIGSTGGRGFVAKVTAICDADAVIAMMCRPLLEVVKAIRAQISTYDRLLTRSARHDPTARRLMTVPGVGP